MEQNEYVITDDFIWDKFDLPLDEDTNTTDYCTVEEIKAEVVKRVEKLNKLGYRITPAQIVEYKLLDTQDVTAGTKPVAKHKYIFVMAKAAARKKNAKYFDTIIYHELCHILQVEFLFNQNLFYYEDGRLKGVAAEKDYIESVYSANDRHTAKWYEYVRDVNSALSINPPIARTLNSKDITPIFLESTFKPESAGIEIDGWCCDYFPEVMK